MTKKIHCPCCLIKYNKRKERCTYCNIFGEMTKDHVIPKCVFNPDPGNIPLVPACWKCNHSSDEQLVKIFCAIFDPKLAKEINKQLNQQTMPAVMKAMGYSCRVAPTKPSRSFYITKEFIPPLLKMMLGLRRCLMGDQWYPLFSMRLMAFCKLKCSKKIIKPKRLWILPQITRGTNYFTTLSNNDVKKIKEYDISKKSGDYIFSFKKLNFKGNQYELIRIHRISSSMNLFLFIPLTKLVQEFIGGPNDRKIIEEELHIDSILNGIPVLKRNNQEIYAIENEPVVDNTNNLYYIRWVLKSKV